MKYDNDFEGIMISGGELEQSVELFDIYNQSHCLLPELPRQIKYHSQVMRNQHLKFLT